MHMTAPPTSIPTADVIIPEEVVHAARRSIGAFFEPISRADPEANIQDFLNVAKSLKRAQILQRYTSLHAKKLLEVGSGFGTNLAVWIKHFDVDGYGVEPGSTGFDQGFLGSQILLSANGLSPDRITDAVGECLPFADQSFDIVYSANVLEHTAEPVQVMRECFRVLRKGGLLHMEMPNFLSYFEGHYLVFQPPIVWKPILPWLVRYVYRRDPSFAKTLKTEINPLWCKKTLRKLGREFNLQLVSLGEDVFLERLNRAFEFEMQTTATRLRHVIRALQFANVGNWIGRLIVALQGHYPIYLTVRKNID
jgi:SAM-dependent methyltransferase